MCVRAQPRVGQCLRGVRARAWCVGARRARRARGMDVCQDLAREASGEPARKVPDERAGKTRGGGIIKKTRDKVKHGH